MRCMICGDKVSGIWCRCTRCPDEKCITVSYCNKHFSECMKSSGCGCDFGWVG